MSGPPGPLTPRVQPAVTSLTEDRQRRTDHRILSGHRRGSQYPSNQRWEQQPSSQHWEQLPPGHQQGQLPGGDSGRRGPVQIDTGIGAALAVAVPWFFWSLCVVAWLGGFFGFTIGWILVAVWVVSWCCHTPQPDRGIYRSAHASTSAADADRAAKARTGWHQVARAAGVDPDRYTIWIQESDDANATPTPGHTIAVTRWALYTVPGQHLEAVLAHELSHHLGGRAWLSLLSFWYSIPARVALIGVRALGRLMRKIPALGCAVGAFLALAYAGILAAVLIFGNGYLWPFLFLTPFVAPPILAWLSRRQVKKQTGRLRSSAMARRWCRYCMAGKCSIKRRLGSLEAAVPSSCRAAPQWSTGSTCSRHRRPSGRGEGPALVAVRA